MCYDDVMSSPVLHLRPEERKIFNSFTDTLKDGWKVEEENRTYEDTAEHRQMRLSLLRVRDPKLLTFLTEAQKEKSPAALAELVHATDLAGVAESDLAELFFALGPATLSMIIEKLLREAKKDEDLADIAALTEIRHSLLSSMMSIS
jgi:hypothetical protein